MDCKLKAIYYLLRRSPTRSSSTPRPPSPRSNVARPVRHNATPQQASPVRRPPIGSSVKCHARPSPRVHRPSAHPCLNIRTQRRQSTHRPGVGHAKVVRGVQRTSYSVWMRGTARRCTLCAEAKGEAAAHTALDRAAPCAPAKGS